MCIYIYTYIIYYNILYILYFIIFYYTILYYTILYYLISGCTFEFIGFMNMHKYRLKMVILMLGYMLQLKLSCKQNTCAYVCVYIISIDGYIYPNGHWYKCVYIFFQPFLIEELGTTLSNGYHPVT